MALTFRVRHVLLALLAVTGVSRVSAQEVAGRVFSPRVNPANPNLISFERLAQDRRELQLLLEATGTQSPLTAAAAASAATFRLDDLSSSERLAAYTGDLDWRPTADAGRYWFAYIGSDSGRLNLFVNYVDGGGKVGLSAPIRVPNGAGARGPRWSPDGRHLAFVSDSGALYIVPEIGAALPGNVSRIRATRAAAVKGAVLFPEWSPVGNYIAYQVGKTDGGRRFGIEIVPVDARGVAGDPLTVGEGTDGTSKFRPSWSPKDGRYIAYYMDRAGDDRASSELFDIGVTELFTDPSGKRIFRSEIKRGRSPRLAEGVLPSATRGPSWTRIGSAGDATPEPSVVYVLKDEARNNPIVASSVQSWIAQKSRQEYSATLSTQWSTANHNDVSSVDMDKKARYSYVAVEGGGERVKVKDADAPWAQGKAPVLVAAGPVVVASGPAVPTPPPGDVVRPPAVVGTRAPAIFIMIPGLAQLYEGRTGRGMALMAVAGAGGVVGALAVKDALGSQFTPADKLGQGVAGAGIAGVAWIIGIVENSRQHSTARVALDVAPARIPDGTLVTRVGVRLPLPGNHR